MTDQSKAIIELATQALAAFKALSNDAAASQADKRRAFEHYEDVLLLIGRQAVTSYEGRTALLTGLIAELTDFTNSIQVDNPIAGKVGELTQLADKALQLFKEEKKSA